MGECEIDMRKRISKMRCATLHAVASGAPPRITGALWWERSIYNAALAIRGGVSLVLLAPLAPA